MNEQPGFDPQRNRPAPPPTFFGDADDPATRPPSPAEQTNVRTPLGEQTAVLGSTWSQQQAPSASPVPSPSPYGTHPSSPTSASEGPRKRRAGVVGVVVASMLLGGAAGFGGAAAFHALDDSEGSTTSQTGSTAKVVNQGASPAGEGSVEAVAASVLPSVVRIDVASSQGSGSGSGIVLSEDGRILTNEHVVAGAGDGATLRVSFSDGTRAEATVLGTDPLTDTAIIQAKDVSGLTPATIGKSSNLAVGQQVVAIGAPFGLDATVTSGIVSALDRPVNVGTTGASGNSTTYPAIQTDAAINPGNSGGPLVDMTGSVIGINSSIRTTGTSSGESGSIGLGFAIPMDPILPIVEQMSRGEDPTHARLGIQVTDPRPDSTDIGALVREVGDGSAAATAGLASGDLITAINDRSIDGADDLVATIRTFRPGDEVELTFLSDGKESTAKVALDSDAASSDS